MPGKSRKGGGLEVKSAYKMKYKHSAFPFKNSPTKLDEGTDYTPFTPPPPTTLPTTGGGDFTSQYDVQADPYSRPHAMVGAPGQEHLADKKAWEEGGGAPGAAIADLDKRVTNLGG